MRGYLRVGIVLGAVCAAGIAFGQAEGPVAVPEPGAEALSYYWSGNVLWGIAVVWGLAVPWILVWRGYSQRMAVLARRWGRRWYFSLCLYLLMFLLALSLLDLPLAFYAGYVRQHAYGLSNQTLGKWVQDQFLEFGVSVVLAWILLWAPYLLLRWSPRRWWLYSAFLVPPVLVVGMLLRPLVFEPLFNTFGPMKDKALEAKILALASQSGIEGSRVYEVAKSVDTNAVNAYVTGFGATKRIVLWDTILAKLNEREVLFVMGHEMGHYVLHHVVQMILFSSLLALAGLYGVHRLANGLLRRYRARFGFESLSDFASLPLLLFCVSVAGFVLTPLEMGFSRHIEHEADRFGLEVTHDNHAAATGFLVLMKENLAVPRPGRWFVLLRGSHPSIGDRIDFFNSYRPWEGEEK